MTLAVLQNGNNPSHGGYESQPEHPGHPFWTMSKLLQIGDSSINGVQVAAYLIVALVFKLAQQFTDGAHFSFMPALGQ